MEKQYYTPKIEEFHIGFRYEEEIKNPNWHKLTKPTEDTFEFVKMEFDTSKSISKITQKIKQRKVRVKYLDHDDIKEAGWEFSYEDTFETYKSYTLNEFVLTKYNNSDDVIITDKEPLDECTTFFDGTVKNYNKLLDVMEMLEIRNTI